MEYDKDNVFAQIIRGESPCNKVYEDDQVLAFHDLYPSAKLHVLVIPKASYISFNDFIEKADSGYISQFFIKIQKIAKMLGLDKQGYRIVSNHGKHAMQLIPHFHMHILGEEDLGTMTSCRKA